MNAAVRILDWPTEVDDELPLALWDAAAVARAVGGTASGDFQVSGVEIDSRDVVEGDLFFAQAEIGRTGCTVVLTHGITSG